MNRCCETCRHDLGGGYDNCRINLEAECSAGNYEAWEPKESIENGYFIFDIARCLELIREDGVASLAEQLARDALEKNPDIDVDKERFVEEFKKCIMDRFCSSEKQRKFADLMKDTIIREINQ